MTEKLYFPIWSKVDDGRAASIINKLPNFSDGIWNIVSASKRTKENCDGKKPNQERAIKNEHDLFLIKKVNRKTDAQTDSGSAENEKRKKKKQNKTISMIFRNGKKLKLLFYCFAVVRRPFLSSPLPPVNLILISH